MATGSPVSFWYGTRAQFDSITTKLDTTLYFITDEQALYKGTVKFSGSGVDTLLTISATEPTASSVTTGDKYFNTTDNLIHVLLNDNGTVSTTATYEPANGALYYNADAQRFQTLIKDGSSYVPTEIYDAGISVEDGTGLVLNGTTVGGLDATTNSKGVVKIGANISVSNGVISVPVATNAVFGVVKSGDNITNTNGVFSVAKATASSLGVVKPGDNINVDNNGQISVPVANGNTKGVVKVSTNIDVADGVISVKDASTSDKGVVQLVNDPSSEDMQSTTKAITPWVVKFMYDDLYTGKQDNISCETPINLDVNRISLAYGDGLAVGVTGTTNANKLIVNEASVKEVLEDVVDGGTEPAVNEIVTADNLKGALSVGQAVDVSCNGLYTNFTSISYDNGTTWETLSDSTLGSDKSNRFLNEFSIKATPTTVSQLFFGWGASSKKFPKRASGLRYLVLFDVRNSGAALGSIHILYTQTTISGKTNIPADAGGTEYIRVAGIMDDSGTSYISLTPAAANTTIQLDIKNWRQYEVTALTDEAIAYIAQLENPDAFFRSNTVDTVKNKYLVKNDMVCPWIKTISMPDNSDLTVASGLAYKIKYTNNSTHTITADTIPADAYGQDAHIKMFIKGTSAIHFTEPLVLMDALTPNAGHNLSVKFRDGQAFVYVDDTDAGYVVTVASGNTNGTLNYAITGGTTDYAIFSADLDGTAVDAGTVTFVGTSENTTMNILGNGTDKTTITGTYNVASGKIMNLQDLSVSGSTFSGSGVANMQNVQISGIYTQSHDTTVGFYGANILNGTVYDHGPLTVYGGSLESTDGTGTFDLTHGGSFIYVNGGAVLKGITFNCSNTTYPLVSFAQAFTMINCTVTGSTLSSNGMFSDYNQNVPSFSWNIENCAITGNTVSGAIFYVVYEPLSLYISGSTITNDSTVNGAGVAVRVYSGSKAVITDSVFSALRIDGSMGTNGVQSHIVLNGYNKCISYIYGGDNKNAPLYLTTGSTLDFSDSSRLQDGYSMYRVYMHVGDNVTLKAYDGVITTLDACDISYSYYNRSGKIVAYSSDSPHPVVPIVIKGSTVDLWKATNAIFGSPLDAHEASTVKLSGTTFTTTAKTLNANRIQLPASTTVSFQGNTNDANTKILDASLIVVGDTPASPSGTATVVNASGVSSSVSGIGTYIDKEGDNDFVANNTTNVVAVDDSTTGAKYLGTVLSATTGDTGANRFAKIDSGAVAVVNEATNAVNKQIITHEYEPILGGTFSLTSATVNEATKTVAIQSGGTMTVVDIRGGKDSVIDLGGTNISGSAMNINGCQFANGGGASGGAVAIVGTSTSFASALISDTVFSGNTATQYGGAVYTRLASAAIVDCEFTNNNTKYGELSVADHSTVTVTGCTFHDRGTNQFLFPILVENSTLTISECDIDETYFILLDTGATLKVSGENKLLSKVTVISGSTGTVTLASGAILDLIGNTNPAPINPGGGITFASGGATVKVGSGTASSSYMMDNVTLPAGAKLTNTAVIDCGKAIVYTSDGKISGANFGPAWLYASSNCVFNNITVSGGRVILHNGSVATDITGSGYATLDVNSGCTMSRAIMENHTLHRVFSGGTSIEPVINSGGQLTVNSGGSALLVTSGTGATVTVVEGGYITYKD